MSRYILYTTGLTSFLTMGLLLAQAQEKGAKIAKPNPVLVVQPAFELKVETKPRFPNENRPAVSTPAQEKSLSVTIQPEKTAFAGNGPLSFLVTFKNKSQSPLVVYGLNHLGSSPKLVISNQGTASQWSVTGDFTKVKDEPGAQLDAGESKTYTLVIESNAVVVPQPMPRPIPFPAPVVEKNPLANPGEDRRILPPRPPVVIGPSLPCGEGHCRAMLLLEFKTDPLRKSQHPVFTGRIATGTVDFQVGESQPKAAPPPVGGAINKEKISPRRITE